MPLKNRASEGLRPVSAGGPEIYKAGKSEKALRLVTACVLPPAFYLVCGLLSVNSALWIVPAAFITAGLYAFPGLICLGKIRRRPLVSIKPLVRTDFLYCLLPALGLSFFAALFLYLFFDRFHDVLPLSLLLCVLFTLTQAYFWLSYHVNNSLSKRLNKR